MKDQKWDNRCIRSRGKFLSWMVSFRGFKLNGSGKFCDPVQNRTGISGSGDLHTIRCTTGP